MKHKQTTTFICFLLAFIIAFFTIQLKFSIPDKNMEQRCENALRQYLEAPLNHQTDNIKISIKGSKITTTIPFSFVYSTATLNSNGIYEICTHTYILAFIFTQSILLIFITGILYTLFIALIIASMFGYKKLTSYTKLFIEFIKQQADKMRDYFIQKRIQKQLKEYDNPEYQRIYKIGYNEGYAIGFSEGSNSDNMNRTGF